MIELKHITYCYPGSSSVALSDVSVNIQPGMHLLMGENGAGKTTMLKVMAGLLIPTRGICRVDGMDVSLREPAELSRTFYLGQETTSPMRDIKTLVARHACFFPRFDSEQLLSYLDQFGISGRDRLIDMSLGTRQKAMLAYALSLNTQVLLLDEPFNGLDIESKETLQRMLISSIDDERIIIVSTHSIPEMTKLYEGVMIMRGSELSLIADTEEITEKFAFVTSVLEVPDAIFSVWRGGAMHSILPVEMAEQQGLKSGPVDFSVLYSAVHSPACNVVTELMNK